MVKSLLTFCIVSFLLCAVWGQGKPYITVTDLEDETLSLRMSITASIFVNQINNAYSNAVSPSFPEECITPEAEEKVLEIWKNSSFYFQKDYGGFKGIITAVGYQIRGIPVVMQEGGLLQNGVINFNPDGQIINFHFSVAETVYHTILTQNNSLQDVQRKRSILDFVEDFRTAYNRKDLNLISQVYGDDVLIITGYVYRGTGERSKLTGLSEEKVRYNLYNKNEYLEQLKGVFAKNRFVNLFFEDIVIVQHPALRNLYGVTLLQKWRSTTYNDDGWLFMAVEFWSDTEMLIHIRTWQPYLLNQKVFPREEVYQLGNFEFR